VLSVSVIGSCDRPLCEKWPPTGRLCLAIPDLTDFLETEGASICCSTSNIWRCRSFDELANRSGGEKSVADGTWSAETDKYGGDSVLATFKTPLTYRGVLRAIMSTKTTFYSARFSWQKLATCDELLSY